MADKTLLVKVRSIFSAAANRVNLVSGEDLEVSLGKISKWLSDLKTVAFTGSYNDLSNKPTIPDISTKVSKSGDTMDGSLTFKDPNSNDGGVIDASYDDYFVIEAGTDKILLLEGPTEVDGYLQLDTVNSPSTSDNDNCRILGFVFTSDDFDRIGRVVRLNKSDIVTLASVTSALGYTPVPLSGGNVTGDIDFYDSDVGFYPGSEHLNGIHGSGGTMWVAFNAVGDEMYVGALENSAKHITINSTGIYINGYKIATLNDIPSAAVSGVKGDTETNYRTGNVNITAANIGAVRYDTSSQGLTTTQQSNARTNLGLGSAATYSSNSFASSTQGGYATDFNNNFKPIFTTSGQSHASVFRGAYLGAWFTSAQRTAISNGSFDDLFVGDYWTINGMNWRIADIDYYYNKGSSAYTKHHLVIVPDGTLGTSVYSSSDLTTGYTGASIRTTLRGTIKTTIANAFGSSYIGSYANFFVNSASSSNANGWGWVTGCTVELMSQMQLNGCLTWGISGYNVGCDSNQFAVFRFAPHLKILKDTERRTYWLRDVHNSTKGIQFNYNGNATDSARGTTNNIRPYFLLTGA